MEKIENENTTDSIVVIKKFVIDQLLNSKNMCLDYRLSYDYMKNCKEKKYQEMMIHKTNKTSVELYKAASEVISSTNSFIYTSLANMPEEKRVKIMTDEKALLDFLKKIKERIDQNDPIFV